ncbi:M64 family metallopeptidase [Pseudomonas viridiflava]|uniref:M64 family metallopeptidase n=1 Tax=Pseudomonas sp. NPDC096925 TaxID=3364484 RepID=UPI003839F52B
MDAAASCSKIVDNGIDGKRFLIAITGDGFTSSQLEAFHQAVTTLISGLNGIVPISWRLQDAINVYQLDTVSSQSGLSPNSALGTASCGASASNLSADPTKVSAALSAAGLTWHLAVVIANTSSAGGSFGGSLCTLTLDSGNVALLARAIAQLVAGLGVEYSTQSGSYPDIEPSSPNLTTNLNAASLKWKQYLTPGFSALPSDVSASGWQPWMIGAFEGGGNYLKGIYRPSQNCLMRDPAAGFCLVCYHELLKAFAPYHQTTGLSWLASQNGVGTWSAVKAVSPPVQPSPIQALATTSLASRLFVFTLANGVIGHNSATVVGNWESQQPMPLSTANVGQVGDIAATLAGSVVVVAALSGNQVWLASQAAGAAWSGFSAIPSSGLPAGCTRVACAVINGQLFVFASGSKGIWLSVRNGAQVWDSGWSEVSTRLGLDAGSTIDCISAGAAVQGQFVHLFAAQGSTLKHAKVNAARAWQGVENVASNGLTPALDLNCAVRDEAYVFLAAATAKGPMGATRNAVNWPSAATTLSALPNTVSRVSAGFLSGTLLAAAS